jgi:hypothetical protein
VGVSGLIWVIDQVLLVVCHNSYLWRQHDEGLGVRLGARVQSYNRLVY